MKCSVYIGNGFDIACGFKTKYSQFIESAVFSELKKNCSLAQWIGCKYNEDKDKWSDLEELLFVYSHQLATKFRLAPHEFEKETCLFKEDHMRLVLALQDYITDQYSSSGNDKIPQIIDSWQSCLEIDRVCCFNYTPFVVLEKLLSDYIMLDRVHGSLSPQVKENDIKVKLGIDRVMKVCNEHSFLYKDTMPRYANGIWVEPDERLIASATIVRTDFHPSFNNDDVIIIYGCSLGRSDTAYYRYLFNNAQYKRIIIYHYGKKEKDVFERRIDELTMNSFDMRIVRYIDSSIDNGYREDFSKYIS